MSSSLSDDARRNREAWTQANAEYTDEQARERWSSAEIVWGLWDVAEASLETLGEVAGRDVVELGCGTAYVSAWLARRGARPVGVDVTPAQLETARRMQSEHALEFPLIEASAEDVPLPAESFDIALSEYGAVIWCDPHLWLAEAYRLLRPGGRLWFMRGSTLRILCTPDDEDAAGERLLRPQYCLGRMEWPDELGVEWHLPTGDLLSVLRSAGFDLLDFRELYAPESARDHPYYGHVTAEWARRWPAEEIWVAEKRR